jgi:Flp pilus assembly protein TadG
MVRVLQTRYSNLGVKNIFQFIHCIRDESGSAIVEFVALAIPLFIPVLIYINSFASISANEVTVRTLAREGIRAYAASDSDFVGRATSKQAIQLIAQKLGLSSEEINSLEAKYECSRTPCLSANSRIRLTITFTDDQSLRVIEASAQENISPWR